jgi:hypothetical protein
VWGDDDLRVLAHESGSSRGARKDSALSYTRATAAPVRRAREELQCSMKA